MMNEKVIPVDISGVCPERLCSGISVNTDIKNGVVMPYGIITPF